MAAQGELTFWGTALTNANRHAAALLGIRESTDLPWAAQEILFQGDYDTNARQMIASLRHLRGTKEVPPRRLWPHIADAGDTPNVFPDGGVLHPTNHEWSLGGFGVWWPADSRLGEPITSLEERYLHIETQEEGSSMWTSMNGYVNSSTTQ